MPGVPHLNRIVIAAALAFAIACAGPSETEISRDKAIEIRAAAGLVSTRQYRRRTHDIERARCVARHAKGSCPVSLQVYSKPRSSRSIE
jgi:hypothetical protein